MCTFFFDWTCALSSFAVACDIAATAGFSACVAYEPASSASPIKVLLATILIYQQETFFIFGLKLQYVRGLIL